MSDLGRVAAVVAALVVLAACGQDASSRAEPATSTQPPDPATGPTPGELDDIDSASDAHDDVEGTDQDPPTSSLDRAARPDAVEPTVTVEVDPPDGWEQADEPELVAASDGHGSVYLHEAACDDGFCAHLHVAVIPGPVTSLEAYHARSKREVEEVLDAELLAEEPTAIDGHDGYQMGYRVDDPDGSLRYLQRYAVIERQVVVATFAATPRLLDQWRADAEALLESITVDLDG